MESDKVTWRMDLKPIALKSSSQSTPLTGSPPIELNIVS